jgi:hypothetical protein
MVIADDGPHTKSDTVGCADGFEKPLRDALHPNLVRALGVVVCEREAKFPRKRHKLELQCMTREHLRRVSGGCGAIVATTGSRAVAAITI